MELGGDRMQRHIGGSDEKGTDDGGFLLLLMMLMYVSKQVWGCNFLLLAG